MPSSPAHTPARFTPTYGMGFASGADTIETVSADSPLPVRLSPPAELSAALAGETSVSQMIGPFTPTTGMPVIVVLAGNWSGSVQVVRSTDSGASFHRLTAGGAPWARFFAPACEQVWEETDPVASLYLDIQLSSGTLAYRLGH